MFRIFFVYVSYIFRIFSVIFRRFSFIFRIFYKSEYIGKDADRIVFGSIQFKMPPVGIAGIIGPPGGGKTPPFKMIMEREQRDVSTIGMLTVPLWLYGLSIVTEKDERPLTVHSIADACAVETQ